MADFILDEPHLMDEDGGFAIANGGKAGANERTAVPYHTPNGLGPCKPTDECPYEKHRPEERP